MRRRQNHGCDAAAGMVEPAFQVTLGGFDIAVLIGHLTASFAVRPPGGRTSPDTPCCSRARSSPDAAGAWRWNSGRSATAPSRHPAANRPPAPPTSAIRPIPSGRHGPFPVRVRQNRVRQLVRIRDPADRDLQFARMRPIKLQTLARLAHLRETDFFRRPVLPPPLRHPPLKGA